MINRKLIFVSVLVVFVILTCLCVVVCIKVLNVPRELYLATSELPSGDKIIIKYYYADLLPSGSGGLKYDIYSGESHSSGQLTSSRSYDASVDVRLTHEIQGARHVKIEELSA